MKFGFRHFYEFIFFWCYGNHYLVKNIFIVQLLKRNIPNFFTALNFLCGCFAIYLAFKNLFEAAFLMVFLGAFFDLFDGFSARIFRLESQFGFQFDSMADLVSFGVAPAVLVLNAGLQIAGIKFDSDFSLKVRRL